MAIEMLKASVDVAGHWVVNRMALGDVYRELGRRRETAEQYNKALTNLDAAKRSMHAERSVEQELFDVYSRAWPFRVWFATSSRASCALPATNHRRHVDDQNGQDDLRR